MAMRVPKILLVSLLTASGARVRYQTGTESMLGQSGLEPTLEAKRDTNFETVKVVAPGSAVTVANVLALMNGWMTSGQKELVDTTKAGIYRGLPYGKAAKMFEVKRRLSELGKLEEASILRANRIISASNVIGALSAAYYVYEGGTFLIEKNKGQQEGKKMLMLSDLIEDVQGVSDGNDTGVLAAALDFSVSNVAFNDAEQGIWDLVKEGLSVVPTSPNICKDRFHAALKPLRQALCKVTCRKDECECDAENIKFSPVDEPMKHVPDDACEEFFSWNGTATEQELERNWPRHLDKARSVVRKVLAENFPSPSLMATSAEALLIDFAHKISEGCELNSSWRNPLGKAAQATRQAFTGADRQATPRDVIAQKVAQIRKNVYDVTCPAVRVAMCRAGCPGYETCEGESPYDEDFVTAVSYKEIYCQQMKDFNSRIEPLCKPGWSTFKAVARSFVSVSSWIAAGSLLFYTSGEALALADDMPGIDTFTPKLVFALQAVTRLSTNLAAGWQDGSKACTEIAKKLIEGNKK